RALTPSSLGKALRRAAGIPLPLRRPDAGPRKALAAAMACAGVGARAETRVRRVSLPGIYVDAHSEYPVASGLARVDDLYTHRLRVRHVRVRPGLGALAGLLASCTLDRLLSDPDIWPQLRFVARVIPHG